MVNACHDSRALSNKIIACSMAVMYLLNLYSYILYFLLIYYICFCSFILFIYLFQYHKTFIAIRGVNIKEEQFGIIYFPGAQDILLPQFFLMAPKAKNKF